MTSTVTEKTDTVTTPEYAPLTLLDSCDQCGYFTDVNAMGQGYAARVSQAYVRVILATGHEMLFCGHHYHVNEDALATSGATVVSDTRSELTVKPGMSAAS